MKNVRRWQYSGYGHQWVWEDDSGETHGVECDVYGWVDRDINFKAPMDCDLIYCWSDGSIEVSDGFDLSQQGTSGMGMVCIVAWQPMPQPFTRS